MIAADKPVWRNGVSRPNPGGIAGNIHRIPPRVLW